MWSTERLRDYEDSISDEACRDDDHIAEVFTSRMQEIAERKAAKAERKREAMAAIRASLARRLAVSRMRPLEFVFPGSML